MSGGKKIYEQELKQNRTHNRLKELNQRYLRGDRDQEQ